jgi:hypothetical protein
VAVDVAAPPPPPKHAVSTSTDKGSALRIRASSVEKLRLKFMLYPQNICFVNLIGAETDAKNTALNFHAKWRALKNRSMGK